MLDFTSRVGEWLLRDDAKDIGKFDRAHHWHVGILMSLLAEAQRLGQVFNTMQSLINQPVEETKSVRNPSTVKIPRYVF